MAANQRSLPPKQCPLHLKKNLLEVKRTSCDTHYPGSISNYLREELTMLLKDVLRDPDPDDEGASGGSGGGGDAGDGGDGGDAAGDEEAASSGSGGGGD